MKRPFNVRSRAQYDAAFRYCFLAAAVLGLIAQILYDGRAATVLSVFPQWLLIGSLWHLWAKSGVVGDGGPRGALVFALGIPSLACLALVFAWLGWKSNTLAICGIVPISDSASYYVSAQTFLRDQYLDPSGQRRPLNILLTSIWLYLSGDEFKLLLAIQALVFSAAAFAASCTVAAAKGFRAALAFFALILVFAEPYLATTLSETNGAIFGVLSLVGFLFGLYRRSFFSYFLGVLFLAIGLAIRPSAMFILPCVVAAGALIFGTGTARRLVLAVVLSGAVLLPVAVSVPLNKAMSRGDGGFNSNLSYTIYGLVSGGKGWEQFQKENPGLLAGLPEARRSEVVMQASWEHFRKNPTDLALGLAKGQLAGPVQTFAQMTRLAFLGAAGDPLRIIPPALIVAISVLFAGVLLLQPAASRRLFPANRDMRLFCIFFLGGYLISIPFFYRDGGLRLHAVVLPTLSYMLVCLLLPPGAAAENRLAGGGAQRLLAGAAGLGFILIGLAGFFALGHPKSPKFEPFNAHANPSGGTWIFRFEPGWPMCDLRRFATAAGDRKPRWFSGAIPDDDYRSAAIREILGRGNLYFGLDETAREWVIIHTNRAVGLVNKVDAPADGTGPDGRYRDYRPADTLEILEPAPKGGGL